MCGKFTQMMSWREFHELSLITSEESDARETVTPMRGASILHLDSQGRRIVTRMRWGWPRPHARDPREGPPKFLHARAETIDRLPTFRNQFEHRRGLALVKTFNVGEKRGSKTIQHTINPKDGKPLALAVLWDLWQHHNEGDFHAFVMVTVKANALLRSVSGDEDPNEFRMPAIVAPEDQPLWLGEVAAPVAEIKAALRTVEGDWDLGPEPKPPHPPKPN